MQTGHNFQILLLLPPECWSYSPNHHSWPLRRVLLSCSFKWSSCKDCFFYLPFELLASPLSLQCSGALLYVPGFGFIFIYPVRYLDSKLSSDLENSQQLSLQILLHYFLLLELLVDECFNLSAHAACLLTSLVYIYLISLFLCAASLVSYSVSTLHF